MLNIAIGSSNRTKLRHNPANAIDRRIREIVAEMSQIRRVAGVLGGMGPDATVDFMARVIALTRADKDQDHLHLLVDHNPTVPNRQAAILGDGEHPGPALAAMARRLEAAGAEFLVIPCNTAYVFSKSITEATRIPLISIIDVTVAALLERCPGITQAGVLATDGCLRAGVFQAALQRRGVGALLPDTAGVRELMALVHRIKGGDRSGAVGAAMRDLARALAARGAEAIVAGCTEIPLVLDDTMLDIPLVSSTDALARETVALACGDSPLPVRR
jgi:aspartate racemase